VTEATVQLHNHRRGGVGGGARSRGVPVGLSYEYFGMSPVERPSEVLRKPEPGPLWPWVKVVSYVELVLFAGLMFVWLAPGFDRETFYFGLSHGIGFIVLALLIWVAVLRHEAPYTLLAATLTPAGPVGAVIGVAWLERREPNYRDDARRQQPSAEAARTKPG
jgi:hypothetical protein